MKMVASFVLIKSQPFLTSSGISRIIAYMTVACDMTISYPDMGGARCRSIVCNMARRMIFLERRNCRSVPYAVEAAVAILVGFKK